MSHDREFLFRQFRVSSSSLQRPAQIVHRATAVCTRRRSLASAESVLQRTQVESRLSHSCHLPEVEPRLRPTSSHRTVRFSLRAPTTMLHIVPTRPLRPQSSMPLPTRSRLVVSGSYAGPTANQPELTGSTRTAQHIHWRTHARVLLSLSTLASPTQFVACTAYSTQEKDAHAYTHVMSALVLSRSTNPARCGALA